MLQPATSTMPRAGNHSEALLTDRSVEITAPDDPLDEADWQALLLQVDREEGGS